MDFKQLYKIAKEQISGIIEYSDDFRLEQAVFNHEDKMWEIVVSYLTEDKNKPEGGGSLSFFGGERPFERVYKKLAITKEGELEGFFIYDKTS